MSDDRLRSSDRVLLALLAVVTITLGVMTEIRSAYLSRRMGDFGCFLRGAWAVRVGGDPLYQVTCNNGWHYNYPPFLAILMAPMADPPRGAEPVVALPYKASVATWFLVNVFALGWGIHLLANVLQPGLAVGGRRWWYLRLAPATMVAVAIGTTLTKGQVNLLVLAAVCGWLAETVRGRGLRAGLYLSIAMAIKIVPGFLLLMPIIRRDLRCLAGVGLGLFLTLAAIPGVFLGPEQTVKLGKQYFELILAPGLGVGSDTSRANELTATAGTDSQTFSALIHQTIYRNPMTRPRDASRDVKLVHYAIASLATLATLWVFRRRGSVNHEMLFGGSLATLMIFASPASHLHYFVFAVPLLMALFVARRGDAIFPPLKWQAWFLACGLLITVASVPGLRELRELCIAVYGGMALWLTGLAIAMKPSVATVSAAPETPVRIRQAA